MSSERSCRPIQNGCRCSPRLRRTAHSELAGLNGVVCCERGPMSTETRAIRRSPANARDEGHVELRHLGRTPKPSFILGLVVRTILDLSNQGHAVVAGFLIHSQGDLHRIVLRGHLVPSPPDCATERTCAASTKDHLARSSRL
jgi:hypothetical protein